MTINFYDTRLREDKTTMLIKEKTVEYDGDIRTDNPGGIAKLMMDTVNMDKLAEEHCYILVLNNACDLIGVFFLSKGTVNASLISAREIFIRALLAGGSMVVLLHNHTSGRAVPSKTDIETAGKIRQAGELVGIPLTDSIIVGGGNYYSFAENSLIVCQCSTGNKQ